MSSSICIPNMTLLACKVVEKSLTKKCYGITEGRTDGRTDGMTDRCKPVYPPLFQSGGIKTTAMFHLPLVTGDTIKMEFISKHTVALFCCSFTAVAMVTKLTSFPQCSLTAVVFAMFSPLIKQQRSEVMLLLDLQCGSPD